MPSTRRNNRELRKERKRKHQEHVETQEPEQQHGDASENPTKKRRKKGFQDEESHDYQAFENSEPTNQHADIEYFGILDEEETETFRHIDQALRDKELSSPDDVAGHVEMAFNYAEGKELKLACSQSLSRFLERLVVLATSEQKKMLIKKFAGHYLSLLDHRFASHVCETLFTHCVPIVTDELSKGINGADSMECLFLVVLDETEGHLDSLLTARFASHVLRLLMLILSGRPLLDPSKKSVVHGKSKEDATAEVLVHKEWMRESRKVPESFPLSISKIIHDSTANMDMTSLRVLAKHPIGSLSLQLMLDLDLTLSKEQNIDKEDCSQNLISFMLPGVPKSLEDPSSPATEFVNGLIFDTVGSRLLEVIIAKGPGKIFKALYQCIFKPKLSSFIKNDTSAYVVLKVLERLSKADLEEAYIALEPHFPSLLQHQRYNVLTTLFERLNVRECAPEIQKLTQVIEQEGPIIPGLFLLDKKSNSNPADDRLRRTALPHAANLANAMLGISGPSRSAIHTSLLELAQDKEKLMAFATESAPTAAVVVKSLQMPLLEAAAEQGASSKLQGPRYFHKVLIQAFTGEIKSLALSQHGHNIVCAVINVPSGPGFNVPIFIKENIMNQLAQHEDKLRQSKEGRRVWYAWNGVLFCRDQRAWTRATKSKVEDLEISSGPRSIEGRGGYGRGHEPLRRGMIKHGRGNAHESVSHTWRSSEFSSARGRGAGRGRGNPHRGRGSQRQQS